MLHLSCEMNENKQKEAEDGRFFQPSLLNSKYQGFFFTLFTDLTAHNNGQQKARPYENPNYQTVLKFDLVFCKNLKYSGISVTAKSIHLHIG